MKLMTSLRFESGEYDHAIAIKKDKQVETFRQSSIEVVLEDEVAIKMALGVIGRIDPSLLTAKARASL